MIIKQHDKYILLADEKDDIADFARYLSHQIPFNFKNKNIVVNLLQYDSLNLSELLLFLKVSNIHRATKFSFVLVNDSIAPDEIPFEMVVVPTLQEAGDIVEMEEIERDLGF